MTLNAKESIYLINPYTPGLSKIEGSVKIVKLSSNENPYGPSPKAIEAYTNEVQYLHRYPDGSATMLRNSIGKVFNLDSNRIICGAGSDEIISLLCLAYASKGDEVIYTEHGFLMYKISALSVGATPVSVPEVDLRTSVDNILAAVTKNTKIVFIANPNNPTGTYIAQQEVLKLRKGLRDDILLVLDGAYAEYVAKEDYSLGNEIVDMGQNTVVTRTFSKIYGLAALRIGWAYCPSEIADVLNRIRGPFNVSIPAISAATAAIEDIEYTEKLKQNNISSLTTMIADLKQIGLICVDSVCNFILIKFKDELTANDAFKHLMSRGIIVRSVNNYGLPQYLRVTIGTPEDNEAVINALKEFMDL
jgi:histidinol-phosphate aminotransferase